MTVFDFLKAVGLCEQDIVLSLTSVLLKLTVFHGAQTKVDQSQCLLGFFCNKM